MRLRPRWQLAAALASTAMLVGCTDGERRDDAGPGSVATPSTAATSADGPGRAGCTTASVDTLRDQVFLEDTGAPSDLTSLDVHSPVRGRGCPPTPVLLWVHGGGWQIGDRRQQIDAKVAWLTSLGWTVVSTNYRLSPDVTYPRHHDDVAAAVDWVIDRAGELDIDPGRIVLAGHSAGAATVVGVATNPRHLATVGRERADLSCVISLDTEGYDVEAMGAEGRQVYLQAFGDDPAIWAEASPMRNIAPDAGIADMLVVTRGTPERRAMSQRFVDALTSAEVASRLIDAGGLDHAAVNRVVGTEGDDVVTPAIAEFLRRC